jgi:signal transduction histidine kinase
VSRPRSLEKRKPHAAEDDPRQAIACLSGATEDIRRAWLDAMERRGLLGSLAPAEAAAEGARVLAVLLECLESGRYHSAQAYAQDMAERDVFRGIGAKQVIGRLLVLRDVCGQVLADSARARRLSASGLLDQYEPVINRILTIVCMAFLQERERALKQSQDLLVRQEKLASLGRMAAGVAHELNNPLSAVAGFAEALQRHVADGECVGESRFGDCWEYLGMIQAEVARAAGIVRRLLDFARQREPTFGPVDLVQAVREAVGFIEQQAKLANRSVRIEPAEAPYQVRGDAQMLQQVFLNLLTNALDAVEAGGEVGIALRGPGPAGPPAGWVEVSVTDTGMGIPPEHLGKVFDPFFTTKEVGKGTGLGLAVSQSIVEQHGGTLQIVSAGPGRGAQASVRLPLYAGEAV